MNFIFELSLFIFLIFVLTPVLQMAHPHTLAFCRFNIPITLLPVNLLWTIFSISV